MSRDNVEVRHIIYHGGELQQEQWQFFYPDGHLECVTKPWQETNRADQTSKKVLPVPSE